MKTARTSMTRTLRRRRPWRPGVTLIETLAALALLAAVAPVLGRAWVLTVTRSAMAADELAATALGRDKLAELLDGSGDETIDSASDGDFAPDYPAMRWRVQRGDWSVNEQLQQVDLIVSWTRAGYERELKLTTLVNPQE